MQRIRFVSRATAQATPPQPHWAVISITEPTGEPAQLQPGWESPLRLAFLDVDGFKEDEPVFDTAMAQQVLDFGRQELAAGKSLLVHCHAGLSRSAAVAIFLGELHQLPVFADNMPVNSRWALYNKYVYRTLSRLCHGY